MSIEVFTDKDNSYTSYAKSQMVLGNTSEAIKNYKKSLELNPNNNNAKDILKKLEKENEQETLEIHHVKHLLY